MIEELGDAKAMLKNCRKDGKGILQADRTGREKTKRDNTVKKDTPWHESKPSCYLRQGSSSNC